MELFVVLLLGTHLFLTVRTGFIQRSILTGIRLSVTEDPGATGDVSQFQALTTALASSLGTGNIVGVGTAVFLGGPGAVFWCWLTGVLGIATKYAESLIAVKYRVKTKDGRMLGGAMYALERGLNMKWLGVLFAFLAAAASFGIGNGTQVNAIAEVLENNLPWLPLSRLSIGIMIGALTGLVILGGIQSIAKVCEKLVPFMAAFYTLGCVLLLAVHWEMILPALKAIVELAFQPGAIAGGLVGQGMMAAARFGVARGLFSNESGMGSAPLVASAARTRNSVRQALVSATGTFWDTVVGCAITGLVIVTTLMSTEADLSTITNGGQLTTLAFRSLPVVGPVILVVGIITFAFATVIGWSYYGERCAEYLFGKRAILPYKLLYLAVTVVAPVFPLEFVWSIADVLNALMAIPNLTAVLLLSGTVAKETKKYLPNLDATDHTKIPVVDH